MGITLPPDLLRILPDPLLSSIVWAIAVYTVTRLYLGLIGNEPATRWLRIAAIWAATLLAFVMLAAGAALYLLATFGSTVTTPG